MRTSSSPFLRCLSASVALLSCGGKESPSDAFPLSGSESAGIDSTGEPTTLSTTQPDPTSPAATASTTDPGSEAGMSADASSSEAESSDSGFVEEPCSASATLASGDTTFSLMVDGFERSYLVHAPPLYDGETRLPVVLDFHGLTGTSAQQKGLSRWDTVGDAEGFVTVYPQGVDNAWNAGLCCGDAADDVAFVRALIAQLELDACIDSRRIYASGCSNGGGMSYRLACEAADVIAGVAPVDFDCVDGVACGNCAPARAVSVVQFRGTNDTLVPYDGSGAFSGAQANFATWGELNECVGEPGALAENRACEIYPSCGGGTETVLCTVQNGTHCGSYGSFMIPQLAWQVLERHALP